jgi:catechol 2,3-dioxygenase-like lactoylglutathione lyase family enzyme
MPRLDLVVLDCPDPRALGAFYAKVLGWSIVSADDDWVDLRGPGGGIGLSFQRVEGYQPPTWLEAGATVHEHQPSENGGFRVYLDPAGHPFCLCRD